MPPPPGGGYQAYQPGGIGASGYGTPAEPVMRLLARFIDGIILAIVGAIITIPFGITQFGSRDVGTSIAVAILGGLIVAAIGIAYEVILTSQRGQTIGKMAVGIKIVRNDGQPLDIQSAATRYSPSIVLSLLGIIPIVGILAALGSLVLAITNIVWVFSKKSSVYDKVGNTSVISAK
jgi:uncharacterized RDD family membrane protein YckC